MQQVNNPTQPIKQCSLGYAVCRTVWWGFGLSNLFTLLLIGSPFAVNSKAFASPKCLQIVPSSRSALAGSGQKIDLMIHSLRKRRALPRLRANIGIISAIKQLGPKRYRSSYSPPWKPKADVALITAELPGCAPGFTTLVIRAEKTITTNVAPNARASLLIGNESFGPVRADAQGRIALKVQLHPAYHLGQLTITGPTQQTKSRIIALGSKAKPRLWTLVRPKSIIADGHSRSSIYLIPNTEAGQTINNAEFSVHSQVGTLSKPIRIANGLYRTIYNAPKSAKPQYAELDIEMLRPKSIRRLVRIQLKPGLDVSLKLLSSASSLLSDGESRALITTVVTDEKGLGIEGLLIQIDSSHGQIGPVTDLGNGKYQAEVIAPVGLGGSLTLTAKLGDKHSRMELPLIQPPPLVLQTEEKTLIADGRSQTMLNVRYYPRPHAPVIQDLSLYAHGGKVPKTIKLVKNRAQFMFQSGKIAGLAKVTAKALDLQASIDLSLRTGKPAQLQLQANKQTLVTDGKQDTIITARVYDKHNNPIEKPNIAFTASTGELTKSQPSGKGKLVIRYTPTKNEKGTAIIRAVSYQNLSSELKITLNQPELGMGLSIAAGILHDLSHGSALISAELDKRLYKGWYVDCQLGFFTARFAISCPFESCPQGLSDASGSLTKFGIPLMLAIRYRFESNSRLTPWVLAGGQMALLSTKSKFANTSASTINVQLGFSAKIGLEFKLGPGGAFMEFGYMYLGSSASISFCGEVGGWVSQLGYRFAM